MTYDKTEKNNKNDDKNRSNRSQKSKICFVEFSDAMMDVDFFASFGVIFLEKKLAMRLPSQKKVSITSLWFKNRTQELDFLELRYYANSVVITLFFKIKQH